MPFVQEKVGVANAVSGSLHRYTETGTANTALVSNTGQSGSNFRLISVLVSYSAAPTQTGVVVRYKSPKGADYDTTLFVGTANAQNTVYAPDTDLLFGTGDSIEVTAPAGGAGITASITLYLMKL